MSQGFRFFEKSRIDLDVDEVSLTTDSGTATVQRLRDRRTYSKWISEGANSDSTTVTITANWNAQKTLDSILLVKTNWREYTIEYWNGAAWVAFSTPISETTNADATKLHQFDEVTTDQIRIQVTKTFVADDEKEAYQAIPTKSAGQFTGYPQFSPTPAVKRQGKELLSGRRKFSDFDINFRCTMTFQRYPVENDHNILRDLWLARQEFLFWPNGGAASDQFRFEVFGSRPEDIFLMQFEDGQLPAWFERNVYQAGLEYSIRLVEVG